MKRAFVCIKDFLSAVKRRFGTIKLFFVCNVFLFLQGEMLFKHVKFFFGMSSCLAVVKQVFFYVKRQSVQSDRAPAHT